MILEMQLCTQHELWFVKHYFKPVETEIFYCSWFWYVYFCM